MKKSHRVAHEKIRGVVSSVAIIIQLLLRLSRFLFQKKIQAPTISCSTYLLHGV